VTQVAIGAISDLSADLAIAKVELVPWKANVREFAVRSVKSEHANITRPVLAVITWAILGRLQHKILQA